MQRINCGRAHSQVLFLKMTHYKLFLQDTHGEGTFQIAGLCCRREHMLCPHIHIEGGSKVRIWWKKQPLWINWRRCSESLLYASPYYLLLLVQFAFFDTFSKLIRLQQQRLCHTKTKWQSFIICALTEARAADAVSFSTDCIWFCGHILKPT